MPNFVEIAENTAEIWRFCNFSKWRRPPSWIFEVFIFNDRKFGTVKKAEVYDRAKFRRNRSNRGRDMAIFRFSAILICNECRDHPRRASGGLYHCVKFGWNRCSSFDTMHVFRFRELARKRLFTPKIWGFDPLNREQCEKNHKRHSLARVCVV